MRDPDPVTETVPVPATIEEWRDLLARVRAGGTRIVFEDGGAPIAAMIPLADLIGLLRRERKPEDRFKALEAIGEKFKDIPAEESAREVAKALSEVREEERERTRRSARSA